MQELEKFTEKVNRYADTDSIDIFQNKSEKHGAIVMGKMFSKANIMNIYSGELHPRMTQDESYLKGLEDFLSRENTQLRIILEHLPHESEALNLLKRYKEKVLIRKLDDSILKDWQRRKVNNHFAFAEKMYRYEIDAVPTYEALCCYNDNSNRVTTLEINFNKLFDKYTSNISSVLE